MTTNNPEDVLNKAYEAAALILAEDSWDDLEVDYPSTTTFDDFKALHMESFRKDAKAAIAAYERAVFDLLPDGYEMAESFTDGGQYRRKVTRRNQREAIHRLAAEGLSNE